MLDITVVEVATGDVVWEMAAAVSELCEYMLFLEKPSVFGNVNFKIIVERM